MSGNDKVLQTSKPTLIRTPDQLQQARRPYAPRPAEVADRPSEASTQKVGILGQLATERAHD